MTPSFGKKVRVAVASADYSGNLSGVALTDALPVPGFALSGCYVDILSGGSVSPPDVTVNGPEQSLSLAVDGNGCFAAADVAPQSLVLATGYRGAQSPYANLDRSLRLVDDTQLELLLIPNIQSEVNPSLTRLDLFKTASGTSVGAPPHPIALWPGYPIDVYLEPFTNTHGFAYEEAAAAAIGTWESRSGLDLFTIVGAPPAQVEMRYRPPEDLEPNLAFTQYTQGTDGLLETATIHIKNDFDIPESLAKTMVHEFGHTLGLAHLPTRGFMMFGGQPLPAEITDDEVWIVQLLYRVAAGTDMSAYTNPEDAE